MIQELGDGRTKEILSEFSCPLNKDVEFFLHCKAIEFARQGIAQTQLVVTSYKDKPVLVGYFTLSNKVLEMPRKNISKNVAKKVNRFAMADSVGLCVSGLICAIESVYLDTFC